MNPSDTTRYKAGDEIVKMIFCQCNKLDEKSHIANRVIILDELFSTNIRRFKSDGGIDAIIKILCSNSQKYQNLDNMNIDDISDLIDGMLNQYKHETMHLGNKGCTSFLTKYLFWHSYSIEEKYDDKFFIYDRIVAKEIGFKIQTSVKGFYKEWYTAMNEAKKIPCLESKNNRDVDLHYWNLGKIPQED
jgi:hypothetical protein